MIRKYQIKATWFLHVKAHEEWLEYFQSFEGQELALHGYEHGTSGSKKKIRANIEKGYQILKASEIEPAGFCAPYGIWNKSLEKVLKDFEFEYSSEFTFAYDGFPFNPGSGLPLQIPSHPICTGSLSRKNLNDSEMADYFSRHFKHKLSRFETSVFYHHPLQPGLKAIERLFELVEEYGLNKLTFNEYAQFWKKRAATNFEIYLEDEHVVVSSDSDLLYQFSNSHDGFTLIESGTKISTNTPSNFKFSNYYIPEAEQLKSIRATDLRLLKTSLLDWRTRIHL